jgi:hypothetical protein
VSQRKVDSIIIAQKVTGFSMKSYRNLKEVQRKESMGRRFSLAGLGILFLGMMASFVPNWYPPDVPAPNAFAAFLQQYWALASFIALPAGFLCASVGSYFINRFARRRWPGSNTIARPDEVLERSMKGFDDSFAYFAHSIPGAPYLLAGPCGVLLFAVRNDRGKIVINGDRWREPFSFGRLLTVFAREGVGHPPQEMQDQSKKVRALLDQAAGDGGARGVDLSSVPIDGAAVFLNEQAQLTIENPVIPVLRPDQVKEYVRRKAKEAKLQKPTVAALTDYLREKSTYQAVE